MRCLVVLFFTIFPWSALACGQIPANLYEWTEYNANDFGLEPELLAAVVWTESRYCVGPAGLDQLTPARQLGVRDPHDPRQNLYGSAK